MQGGMGMGGSANRKHHVRLTPRLTRRLIWGQQTICCARMALEPACPKGFAYETSPKMQNLPNDYWSLDRCSLLKIRFLELGIWRPYTQDVRKALDAMSSGVTMNMTRCVGMAAQPATIVALIFLFCRYAFRHAMALIHTMWLFFNVFMLVLPITLIALCQQSALVWLF